MNTDELKLSLDAHKEWINTIGKEGQRLVLKGAYLKDAYLRGANLKDTNLKGADLRGADLRGADLRGANLKDAYLRGANLRGANLKDAYLRGANLKDAYLRGADLRGADLRGADLDFSAFPLWCGGLDVHIDDRIAIQLLYHLVRNVIFSKNTSEELKKLIGKSEIIDTANRFHRINECGKIKK